MKLTSTAFDEAGTIPVNYSCDHNNISPQLTWTDVPEGSESFAIIVDDPDAPAGTWLHWLIYNIPPKMRALSENLPNIEKLQSGALQGLNDFHKIGYGGPCPPEGHGPHHYQFKLYALDEMLDIESGEGRDRVEKAMKDHILDRALLTGLYER
jgi:Raf kinase inhibitor-like YbhB/YbcL family protein